MRTVAILAAAGRGTRLGPGVPKQFLPLGGRPMLQWSLEAFERSTRVDGMIVALPAELAADPPAWLRGSAKPLRIVAGGERRQDSVSRAFREVPADADIVVVHDGARPFVTQALIARVVDAAAESGAAIAALAARDTVKEALPADAVPGARVVGRTLRREIIHLAQTPQAFRREWLAEAMAAGGELDEATDEAALVERTGRPVRLVDGDPGNLKITTMDDLRAARDLAERGAAGGRTRVGIGYDVHRLAPGRALILGGVRIPHEAGLVGHSDADALCHAVIEAILGAAAAGDIGRHFPDGDARWAGASSLDLLRRAADVVARAGFAVANVDAVVVAERPRLASYIPQMRQQLAAALGIDAAAVSVKGKSNDGIGALGRGEAIAAHAVALLDERGRSRDDD